MMDKLKTNNNNNNNKEHAVVASFEYAYPGDPESDDDPESNKSTPYYTPLEYLQTSFEFPSPTTETAQTTATPTQYHQVKVDTESTTSSVAVVQNASLDLADSEVGHSSVQVSDKADGQNSAVTTKTFTLATPKQQQQSQQHQILPRSPSIGHKLKRFSLLDRRSCSPQHLGSRNSTVAGATATVATAVEERTSEDATRVVVDNKENTVPKNSEIQANDDSIIYIAHTGGQNSPSTVALREDSTPNDATRLSYSPKLLASINNLNITGSPLALINSAGYKNGNFFRFPEIDHVVQADYALIEPPPPATPTLLDDNHQLRVRQKSQDHMSPSTQFLPSTHHKNRFRTTLNDTAGTDPLRLSPIVADDKMDGTHIPRREPDVAIKMSNNATPSTYNKINARKNRKNKNNLTIRITDGGSVKNPEAQLSPMPRPKTPTIKSTKEKARSLDSAANEHELSIAVHQINESHASSEEVDPRKLQHPDERALRASHIDIRQKQQQQQHANQASYNPANIYASTSLTQLDSNNAKLPNTSANSMACKRRPRRASPGKNNSEWMTYHRKHNPYHLPQSMRHESGNGASNTNYSSLDSDTFDCRSMDLQHNPNGDIKSASSIDGGSHYKLGPALLHAPASAGLTAVTLTPQRGMLHKHNQILHSSSTNLKTLPECLTLVEFSTTVNSPGPYKQKSMELPVCTQSNLPGLQLQSKNTASTSSMNLLQRRGSNHSLTLNLHSSCGNLMNSGLSVSNYSLGSVSNFNTILNSKSSCNLDINASGIAGAASQGHTPQTTGLHASNISQNARQSLFRRRGSTHTITLKGYTTATSCVDLNSLSIHQHQQTGLTDRSRLNCQGMTRTTSNVSNVITPKRGLLERRGSNQSLTLNMSNVAGAAVGSQQLGNNLPKDAAEQLQATKQAQVCTTCAASQAAHQRKFFSTENLNANRGSAHHQLYDFNTKQMCFGSASDLKPSEYTVESISELNVAAQAEGTPMDTTICTCTGGVRNIMTRPLSPQTTSEEFKIYLAGIQMLQSASNPLNQFDLIKLNYIFDNSYQPNNKNNIIDPTPPVLNESRDSQTPTSNQSSPQINNSEECALLSLYQAVVAHYAPSLPQLEDSEQKRIFRELHKEFWDLPLNHQEKPMVFGSQTKNRYKTILPNEHSRVILETEAKELQNLEGTIEGGGCIGVALDDPVGDTVVRDEATKSMVVLDDAPYINANYIKGPDYVSKCYVATQGPMLNTIFDFWLMIYQNTQRYIRKAIDGGSSSSPHVDKRLILQQYYQKIIMLTNFTENNRQKCAVYFPVEVNEIVAVAAKQETFQLSAQQKEFFEPYLCVSASVKSSHTQQQLPQDEIDFGSSNIGIEFCKIKLSNSKVIDELPSTFFLIKNVGIVRRNGYSIRKFVLLYCIRGSRTNEDYHLQKTYCFHYWYPDWPDHHSPRDINTLLDTCLHVLNLGKCESEFDNFDEYTMTPCNAHMLAQRVELYKQDIFNAVQPLPIIHCSAGIGRTGCFTAILNAVRQLRQSLAYSLTAMLSKALTTSMATLLGENSHQQAANDDELTDITDNNTDTDSSFTRNTLLHISHILLNNMNATDKNVEVASMQASFANLPKMPDIYVDILGIVCNLRLQRGGMVQNSEQYELIHRAVCLYLKRTLALRRF